MREVAIRILCNPWIVQRKVAIDIVRKNPWIAQ